jgi:hypothetical protein
MKQQVQRFSLHQNAKVFAVLMTLSSCIFIIPMALFASAFAPAGSGPSGLLFLLMPLIYLVFGYISVAIGCAIYNFMFRYIGGIEFEAQNSDA